MTIAKIGDTVRVHYTGRLDDGSEFDSSAGRDPLEFEIGAGQIIPGLERQIVGMGVGDRSTFTVPASEAYGPVDTNGIQRVPRSAIPTTEPLAVGGRLLAETEDGEQLMLTIIALDDMLVTLDSNHPLAGKDLVFEIELVEIV